jgi:hypothetical protein
MTQRTFDAGGGEASVYPVVDGLNSSFSNVLWGRALVHTLWGSSVSSRKRFDGWCFDYDQSLLLFVPGWGDELRGMMTNGLVEARWLGDIGDGRPLRNLPRSVNSKIMSSWLALHNYMRATRSA